MKITFILTVSGDKAEGRTFNEGETYDLNEASAQRWIRRGMAVPYRAVEPETATAPPVAEQAVSRKPKRKTRRAPRKPDN